MNENIGIYKEDEFINALNNKKFGELNDNLKAMLKRMFVSLQDSNIFHVERIYGFLKPDFFIECRGEVHFVSLKTGSSIGVHQERLKTFIEYLREKGISEETIKTILLYQYGDGTLDGTGERRMPIEEINYRLLEQIKAANLELNSSKDFIYEFIQRAIFVGVIEPKSPADYVYHGDIEHGVICSRKQINKHLKYRTWSYIHGLHIGPLRFRPHARYVGVEIKNPESREKVDFEWIGLQHELSTISDKYLW
ncbi:MAG: hypothetical protein MJ248_00640 [Bacilli bacterium]|nr:hypothetical protein [Bacilli bacterium]